MPDGGGAIVGGISKLTIRAFKDSKYSQLWPEKPNPIRVPINPESYSQSLAAQYSPQREIAADGRKMVFSREKPVSLKLKLVFDGTGAVPGASRDPVQKQVHDLRRMGLMINGAAFEPNYLELSWGSLLFKGRLNGLDIDYTLFAPDGMPLRADVNATFLGSHDTSDRGNVRPSSSDLGELVTVGPGETLPALCDRIYGDSRYYPEVAAANGLDGFRALKAGMELLFPPLARAGR